MGRTNIGNVTFVTAPITGADVSPLSGDNINASALQFAWSRLSNFALAVAGTPVTREEIVYVANNSGTFKGVHASVKVPGSSASVTIDVKKNGTTILSAPITLTDATAAGVTQNGTITVTSFVAGDIVSIALTVSSSTGMSGVVGWVNGVEISQPL